MAGNSLVEKTKRLKETFEAMDIVRLRTLSNDCIEEAVISKDKHLVKLSLIAYALSKLISKERILKSKHWKPVQRKIVNDINNAELALEQNDLAAFEARLDSISKHLTVVDTEIGNFVMNLIEKAKLKQASNAYAFGLSLNAAAGLTGTNETDLLQYLGGTKMIDEHPSEKGIKKRLKELEKYL